VVEPKFDGLTVVLHYEQGRFVLGATRGDGDFGENITANLRTVRVLPLQIPGAPDAGPPPARLVLRGEGYVEKGDFERFNRARRSRANAPTPTRATLPRAACASLTLRFPPGAPLKLWVYQALIVEGGPEPPSHSQALAYLRDLGLPVCPDMGVFADTDFEQLAAYVEAFGAAATTCPTRWTAV
jgi:DNA ligase (NAD+)